MNATKARRQEGKSRLGSNNALTAGESALLGSAPAAERAERRPKPAPRARGNEGTKAGGREGGKPEPIKTTVYLLPVEHDRLRKEVRDLEEAKTPATASDIVRQALAKHLTGWPKRGARE